MPVFSAFLPRPSRVGQGRGCHLPPLGPAPRREQHSLVGEARGSRRQALGQGPDAVARGVSQSLTTCCKKHLIFGKAHYVSFQQN